MALTRAQYLSGNTGNGVVLPGQPQGVIAGSGITISSGGVISINGVDPTVTGLVKTNNASAYNNYVWPNVIPGSGNSLLQIDTAGQLSWVNTSTVGGVNQLVAGANITLSPASGVGIVTINSTGGGGSGGLTGLQEIDDISGSFDGVTLSFPITISGGQPIPDGPGTGQLIIAVGGVTQTPGISFTFDNATDTLTFTSAPPSGVAFSGYVGGAASAFTPSNTGFGLTISGSAAKVSIPTQTNVPPVGSGVNEATIGSLYWDNTLGALFIYYNDGNTAQWVQAAATAAGGGGTSFTAALGLNLTGNNLKVSIPVADTPPTAGAGTTQAIDGSLYWDDNLGALFIRYNNGGTPTWVQASGAANVITTNATYYVATTGNDTTGNGSATAPWATPHKAMEYLSAFTIKQGVAVTISVADGSYTFTTPLNLNHPNGSQIFINGGTTTGVRPTTSLTGGNAVGNTGATLAANDALLNAYYNTKWQFNGCNGLVCTEGGGVTVNTVLVRGNAAGVFSGVFAGLFDPTATYSSSGGITLGSTVAVHNFGGQGLYSNYGGSISANGGVTVTNCGVNGIVTNFGGSIFATNAVCNNNGGTGIITQFSGGIFADGCVVRYNSVSGATTFYGGSIWMNSGNASNNTQNGIATNYGGSILAGGATASNNGVNGVVVIFGGSIYFVSGTANGNSEPGITTNYGGSINANNAIATGNGGTANVYGSGGGNIYFVGGDAAGSFSPAANTVGNGNALITV